MGMIRAGTAKAVINNEIGTDIQAATHQKKVAYIRDDLEANALRLDVGDERLLWISCDVGGLELDYVNRILPDVAEACGLTPDQVLIGCTHTHAGPAILGPTGPGKPLDEAYMARLRGWLIQIAASAAESLAPAQIAYGRGDARIGYNRRCCWADGTHTMHGNTRREDFTGLEGDDDPQHTAIFVRDMAGVLKAVLYNNTGHTTTFYGSDFLSADFPGLVRTHLRGLFGDIGVLFFNGAIGDISIENQLAPAPHGESKEQKMARVAHLLTGETLRLLHEADFVDTAVLKHRLSLMDVPVRVPSAERLQWARALMAEHEKTGELNLDVSTALQTILLHERFGENPTERIRVHAACLNDLAFVSVPCEMFCHFGLRIKARSPFPITAFFGLVDGDMGYCPTTEGVMGGHWGGTPMLAARWDPSVGYRITDELVRVLCELYGAMLTAPG